MKTKLFFLAFLTSLLSWGQATLPVSRTSNWNTATVTGWTHTGTTDRTSTFACSGSNAETFDTTGDRIVLFVNAAPNQLIFKLKSASMSGASSLLVEQSNDGSTYTTLGNYGTASGATTITDCADITLSLNNATRYIRWTYTRSSGNVDIDDVSVSASAGPAPILAITPATTNLGSSCVGISTTPVVYTITNSGTVAANGVTVISSGANAANFVVSGLSSTTIAAGGTATYTVTFTPSATGVRNATITVASTTSGSNSPTTALTGTGNATVSAVVTSGAATTTTAIFNNAMRNIGYSNNQFYRSANVVNSAPDGNIERHRIWLDLVSPTNQTTRTLVAYVEGATEGKDRMFDALTDYKSAQNFYSLIDDQVMTIQGKGLPFYQDDKVPLGIKIASNGIYKIAIGAIDGLFEQGQNIYLEDKLLGIIHDLRQAPYTFTGTSGIVNNRFVLRYTNETLGNDDFINNSDVLIFSSDLINIQSFNQTIQSVTIHNVLGQLLVNELNVNSDKLEIKSLQKNKAPLIVQVTLENGKKIVKKLIF